MKCQLTQYRFTTIFFSGITENENTNEHFKTSKSVYFCVLCSLPVSVISAPKPIKLFHAKKKRKNIIIVYFDIHSETLNKERKQISKISWQIKGP